MHIFTSVREPRLRGLSSRSGDLKDILFVAMELLLSFNDGDSERQPQATYQALRDLATTLEALLAEGNGAIPLQHKPAHRAVWLRIRVTMGGYAERGYFTMGDAEETWATLADFEETLE